MYYYIHTFGCKVNQYESQLINEIFEDLQFDKALFPENANIIIVNSCTVTANADKKCKSYLKKISRLPNKPKIILIGCITKSYAISEIKSLFPNILVKDKEDFFREKKSIKSFDKHYRAFLKIQDGCKNFCSYCIIPYIRSTLWSKNQDRIISEIEQLVKNGYSEVVLTGINIGEYKTGISNLLKKIVKIPLDFRIRLSSIELNAIDSHFVNIMKLNQKKLCAHLHIPIQSGNNNILKEMGRRYSTEKFKNIINELVKVLPKLAVTTDIITGFPGETEEQHRGTCDLIKKIPFARLHIFKYSDRIGTKAYSLSNKISLDSIRKRAYELRKIDKQKRKKFIKDNVGEIRKAIKISKDKVLTDNYITVKMHPINNKGIFRVKITKDSII
ncbi:MAG: MiaB/RimO family radical SAM methylthiotransferase [Endomicrobium sp.]|jgi:threonylcarbamoyladenosine tRNA methylthiotransferase MtaB|nr:MiaB/RimO family radical SAM methylthiotransferase [Endomicrobium sp.]